VSFSLQITGPRSGWRSLSRSGGTGIGRCVTTSQLQASCPEANLLRQEPALTENRSNVLAPARDCDAEEERDEQAGEGGLARDRRHRRERPSGFSRFIDRVSEAIDCGSQTSRNLADGMGHVGRRIDGTLGHAGLGIRLWYLRAQASDLRA